MKIIFSFCFLFFIVNFGFSQSSYYTQFQGGGNIGVSNPKYQGTFNGYSLHFIFGKNFNEKAFLGLGLGNETLKGDYSENENQGGDSKKLKYDRNLFPIFIDARFPFKDFGEASRIGVVANAGYAPSIGPVYDKGFLGKAGLFYLFDSLNKTKFTISATYVYQQLHGNYYGPTFYHQHINLSAGIMLK